MALKSFLKRKEEMRQRRKALVILGFETPDQQLTRFQKTWNKEAVAQGGKPVFQPTTSADFLIARDKETKRPGFIEVELLSGETPMQAILRMNPFSSSAITRAWQEVDVFPYRENENLWEVQVGLVLVHENQRQVDLYDQPDDLPFLVEWQTPAWLFQQHNEDILNLVTSVALARPRVREFLAATQKREAV